MMRPREEADCGPTRFAVGDYLGHGASGAVFAVVVANDAGEALGPGGASRRATSAATGGIRAPCRPRPARPASPWRTTTATSRTPSRAPTCGRWRPRSPSRSRAARRRRPRGRGGARGGGARAAPPRPAALGTIVEPLATWRWCDAAALAAARLGPTVSDVLRRGGERAGGGRPSPSRSSWPRASWRPSCRATRRACSTATSSPTTSCSGRPPPAPPAPPRPATATRPRRWRRRGAARPRPHGLRARRRPAAPPRGNPVLHGARPRAPRGLRVAAARADRRRAPRPRAPWVHEIDTYAVGVCLHLIATGAWPTRDGRRQGTPPRAWDRDLWTSLIDAHLHTDPDAGAPSLARRRAFVAATRAALDASRFEDLDAELRRWCRRAAG